MKPTILISLIKDTPRRFPGRRPQPWRYLVKDAGNSKFYEKSSENLTNRGDAIDAIIDVHGPDATVILREEGKDDIVIREPQKQYPHPGMADTTIIGPECFVANDGSVLMWRGQDYVPAPVSRRIALGDHELDKVMTAVGERITGMPFTNRAVLARVIDIINDVITEHEDHVHTAVTDEFQS